MPTSNAAPVHWIIPARRIYRFLAHPLDCIGPLPWFALGTMAALGLMFYAAL